MNLIFYESLPYWVILSVLILFLILTTIVLIKNPKHRKKYIFLFIIRAVILSLILLYFFKPAIQNIQKEEYLPEIPVFIDSSFSMLQDIQGDNKIQSRLDYAKGIYKNYFQKLNSQADPNKQNKEKLQFRLYNWIDDQTSEVQNIESLKAESGIFNFSDWLNFLKGSINLSSPAVVLLTDLNHNINAEEFKGLKQRIYIPTLDHFAQDLSIKSMDSNFKRSYYSITMECSNQYEKSILAELKLLHKNKLIYKQKINLKAGLNYKTIKLRKRFKEKVIIKAEILHLSNESNRLNNVYYLSLEGKEAKKNIQLYFGKPSYNLSFLRQFLKKQAFYNNQLHLPKLNEKLRIKPTSIKDCIIIGNIDSLDSLSVKRIKRFTQKGGLTIFLRGNSNLVSLNRSPASDFLPFAILRKYYSKRKNNLNLVLSHHGLKYPFLNFREKKFAQTIWNDLPFFSSQDYYYRLKKNTAILATIEDQPAILLNQYSKGYIITILTDSLWKIDFSNLSYGIKSQYYDQFWDELIQFRESKKSEKKISLSQDIIEYGKEITLFFPAENFQDKDQYYIETEKGKKIPLILEKKQGLYVSKYKTNSLGKNSIYQLKSKKNNAKYLSAFYVNYPLWESVDLDSKKKEEILKQISKLSKGRIIHLRDLTKLDGKYFRLEKEAYKVISDTSTRPKDSFILSTVFLLVIILLFTLEWYLKKFVWKL